MSCHTNRKRFIGDNVLPALMAITLSLTPSIGFFYAPIYAITGTYINVLVYCIAFIILALFYGGFVIRNTSALLVISLTTLVFILVSMLANFSGDQADWIGYQRYFFYVVVFYFYSALVLTIKQMDKVAKYYLALMFFWGLALIFFYLVYGPEGLLLLSRHYVEIIGHDANSYYGSIAVTTIDGDEFMRPTLPGLNNNTTAYLFLLAIPISYYQWLYHNSMSRRISFLFLFVFFSALAVLTLSRQAIVLTTLFALYVVFSEKHTLRRMFYLAALCVVAVAFSLYYPVVVHRLLQPLYFLFGYQYDYVLNTSDRFESIDHSISLIFSNPLGIGYSAYRDLLGYGVAGEHNLALEVSINNGLVVGALLVTVTLYTILRYHRCLFFVKHSAVGMAFAILNYMMLISIMFSPNPSLFWIYFGVSNAYLNSLEGARVIPIQPTQRVSY